MARFRRGVVRAIHRPHAFLPTPDFSTAASRRGPASVLLGLLLIVLSAGDVVAQSNTEAQPDSAATDWVDDFVESHMDSLRSEAGVPGLVVAITSGDRVLSLRANGLASIEADQPMSADSTVLRVASVSKPFTATLLKLLHEDGAFDLDATVPPPAKGMDTPSSITAAHLLAHTSGLDGRLLGGGNPVRQPLLGSLLKRRLPPQIDSVGTLSRYSNEGYAWAGVAAGDAVGTSFPDLMAERVFEPLGMMRSTFEGKGGPLEASVATGYRQTEEGPEPLMLDYITLYPAGGMWTTGADAASFLQAVLNRGQRNGEQVLSAAAVSFSVGDPRDAYAGRRGHLGWFHRTVRGADVFTHGGTYPGAGSFVLVAPDLDLGVFVAGNAVGASEIGTSIALRLVSEWVERSRPTSAGGTPEAVAVEASTDLSSYDGTYRIARRPHTSFESFFTLFGAPYPDVDIRVSGDTALVAYLADGVDTLRYTGDATFQHVDERGVQTMAYGTVRGEGPTPRLQIGAATFEQIGPLQSRSLHFAYLILCVLTIGSIFILPIREFFRPGASDDDNAAEGMQYARPLATFAAALHIGFLFALAFRVFTGGALGPIHTDPGVIRPLLAFPIVASVLSLGLLVFVVRAWMTDSWSMIQRLHFSAVTTAMIVYIPFLLYWGLIGMPVA